MKNKTFGELLTGEYFKYHGYTFLKLNQSTGVCLRFIKQKVKFFKTADIIN